MDMDLDIPPAWRTLDFDRLRGVILILGGSDAGKSSLGRFLYREFDTRRRVAYLDGDPGQGVLGPPTTMTVALSTEEEGAFPPDGPRWRRFVGSTSPVGHMLPLVIGAAKLVQVAGRAGAEVVIYDTTGLLDRNLSLKWAKIDLLNPTTVIALQKENELECLLRPLRRCGRVDLVELPCSPSIRSRCMSERQAGRADRFERYFAGASDLTLYWPRWAVFPEPAFSPGRLVALEDKIGFIVDLGLVREVNSRSREVTLFTPCKDPVGVDVIRLGDVAVDATTFRDEALNVRQG